MKNRNFICVLRLLFLPTVLILSGPGEALGQLTTDYKDIIPKTPEVAEIEKYVYTPVSYYTGVPDISIPLGEVKSRTLSVPVTLTYHAGGIRVDEEASNAGLGWSLNAGGVISQSIRDEDDLRSTRYIMTEEEINALTFLPPSSIHSSKMDGADSEPDIFTYSFLGFSGQFLMDKDGTFYDVKGSRELDIKWVAPGFVLTDRRGNKYYFNDMETCHYQVYPYHVSFLHPTQKTQAGPHRGKLNQPTAYHLSRITSADGTENIFFTYTGEQYTSVGKLTGSLYYSPDANQGEGKWIEEGTIEQTNTDDMGSLTPNYNSDTAVPYGNFYITTTVLFTKRLASITTDTGEACHVSYDTAERTDLPGTHAVKGVSITSKHAPEVYWELTHEYFTASPATATGEYWLNYRLKLKTLKRRPYAMSSKALVYSFDYYGEAAGEPVMPFRNAMSGQDLWGFCNGAPTIEDATSANRLFANRPVVSAYDERVYRSWSNFRQAETTSDLLPARLCFIYGSDREVNGDYTHAYTLKRITWPTGGCDEYFYEPNEYSYASGYRVRTAKTGGLRIKEIRHRINHVASFQKYYYNQYENGELRTYSSGCISYEPGILSQTILPISVQGPGRFNDIYLRMGSNTLIPSATIAGDYMGYGYVTEVTGEGRTIHKFSTAVQHPELFHLTLVDWVGSYTVPFSTTGVAFPTTAELYASEIPAYNGGNIEFRQSLVFEPSGVGFYGDCHARGLPLSETVTDTAGHVVSSTIYHYRHEHIADIGGMQPYTIPSGYAGPLPGAGWSGGLADYQYPSHYDETCLAIYHHTVGRSTLTSKTISEAYGGCLHSITEKYTYNTDGLPVCKTTLLNASDSLSEHIRYPSDIAAGIYQEMAGKRMLDYPVETTKWRNGSILEAHLTEYQKSGTYYLPTAVYSLASRDGTAFCDFDGQTRDSRYGGTPELGGLAFDQDMNLLAATDRSGLRHVFVWDTSHRLRAEVQNATLAEVEQYCPTLRQGTATATQLAALRTGLPAAMVTVYSYNPDGTLAQITDPRGAAVTFTHDAFGRLTAVRDLNGMLRAAYKYKYSHSEP